MTATVDRFAEVAAEIAMRGAAEYLRANRLQADPEALCECLRSWVEIQLPIAMKDAKDAIDCGMAKIAETTFSLSMAKAGIEAAKEAGFPIG